MPGARYCRQVSGHSALAGCVGYDSVLGQVLSVQKLNISTLPIRLKPETLTRWLTPASLLFEAGNIDIGGEAPHPPTRARNRTSLELVVTLINTDAPPWRTQDRGSSSSSQSHCLLDGSGGHLNFCFTVSPVGCVTPPPTPKRFVPETYFFLLAQWPDALT